MAAIFGGEAWTDMLIIWTPQPLGEKRAERDDENKQKRRDEFTMAMLSADVSL